MSREVVVFSLLMFRGLIFVWFFLLNDWYLSCVKFFLIWDGVFGMNDCRFGIVNVGFVWYFVRKFLRSWMVWLKMCWEFFLFWSEVLFEDLSLVCGLFVKFLLWRLWVDFLRSFKYFVIIEECNCWVWDIGNVCIRGLFR